MQQPSKHVALVAFYNTRALGVRYLESALRKHGYEVTTIYFKDFNSIHPRPATAEEVELLCGEIERCKPAFIALSVMSSMYLDTVNMLMERLQQKFDLPIACGGAFATMFPEYLLERGATCVLRSDGEHTICQLADAIVEGRSYHDIPSLCYRDEAGEVHKNEIGCIENDIDLYGLPTIHCPDSCFIESNTLKRCDPQLEALSYEVVASRGCPFTCSYCAGSNLSHLNPKGIRTVRTRSVESVMEELIIAKKSMKKLVFVHFYDEIFPNTPGWVDKFVVEYKKHINLPFTIWSHPKMVNKEMLDKLVKVGLTEVIMGIQTGSPRIRKDIFHRYESSEDVIKATQVIHDAGVFWATYDFMLQHPFETIEDIQQSFHLIEQMVPPFELQLHGLNFLPGTDIIPLAIEQGYYTKEELNHIMFAPMEEQFNTFWKWEKSEESSLWFELIYCLQFPNLRAKAQAWSKDPWANEAAIHAAYAKAQKQYRTRYLMKKGRVVLKSMRMRVFGR
ncbi:MAG: B12-binding domain-containing radical SAM protein [Oscillospiraceae bacterium]|nr:B12-binding domain-containing radical SAM protein [Oscillospiraceae bacterium]